MTQVALRPEVDAYAVRRAPSAFTPDDDDRTAEIGDLWRILWRRRVSIVVTSLALVAAALVYSSLTPALYSATAQLLIDPRDRQVVTNDINPTSAAPDGGITQVESQVRVIESSSVLGRAIASLNLTRDPEFGGEGALTAMLRRAGALIGLSQPEAAESDAEERTMRALKRRLSIKRADKVFVIDTTVTARSAEKSARIANAIATAYLVDQSEDRAQVARRASAALAARLDEQRERVRAAENRVEAYKAAHGIVRSTGTLVAEQQLSDLNVQLGAARGKTADLKARIDQIDQLRRGGLGADATAEALGSAVIAKLRAQYAELVEKQADLASQLGPRHPAIVSSTAQMNQIRQLILAELDRIGRAARADYDRARSNEQALATSLDRLKGEAIVTGQASVELRELERDVEASRGVYTAFLVRTRELREQSGIDSASARIITRASPPTEKSWPMPGLFALGALAAGIGLGTGLAVLREYARPTVLSRRHLRRLTGAPVVGVISDKDGDEPANAAGLILGRLLSLCGNGSQPLAGIFVTSGAGDGLRRRRAVQLIVATARARGLRVLFEESEPAEESRAISPFLDMTAGDPASGPVIRVPGERLRPETGRRFDLLVVDGGAIAEASGATPALAMADVVLLVAAVGVTFQHDVIDAREAAALAGQPISAALLVAPRGRA